MGWEDARERRRPQESAYTSTFRAWPNRTGTEGTPSGNDDMKMHLVPRKEPRV